MFRSATNRSNSRQKKPKTGQAPTEINTKPAGTNILDRTIVSRWISLGVLDWLGRSSVRKKTFSDMFFDTFDNGTKPLKSIS